MARSTRALSSGLIAGLCLTSLPPSLYAFQKNVPDASRLAAYAKSLPEARVPGFGVNEATMLAAWPLACIDRPQPAPEGAQYLWLYSAHPQLPSDYDKTRAFYSCFDWHSAVNSLWTMVALSKDYPDLPLFKLAHEKLTEHLGPKNIAGEVEFFKQSKGFERPYGYAWLLKLYAEIKTWNDPDAQKLAANLDPLVKLFSPKLIEYYDHLLYPSRPGIHPNTALTMTLVLDYTTVVPDDKLRDSVLRNASRLFLADRQCPTAFEPGGTEFLSPCLAEAHLMSRVLPQPQFVSWLDNFLPPLESPQFQTLSKAVDVSSLKTEEELAGKSHLIGLAFQRAMAMIAIADALPANDPRRPVLHKLADINASRGLNSLSDAGYLGSHWLATYAVLYLRAARHAPPQPSGPATPAAPVVPSRPNNKDSSQ